MRVYHFCGAKYGMENVEKTRLKIATIMELNDPFEMFAHEMSDIVVRKAVQNFKRTAASQWGMVCFSRSFSSPVQWAHYAEKHQGICLGFDVPDDNLHKVNYVPKRLLFDPELVVSEAQKMDWYMTFFTHKNSQWNYEKEERLFVPLDQCTKENGLYFCSFESLGIRLKQILVGCVSKVQRGEVKALAASFDHEVEIGKMRTAFNDFKMVHRRNPNIW